MSLIRIILFIMVTFYIFIYYGFDRSAKLIQ